MRAVKLSKRLSTAASFVRDGAIVADIGTDHAYIPIYLTSEGKARYAIASDINEGPMLRARENVIRYGLSDKITVCKADGLYGIEAYKPTDIVICGMGGELIAEIIDACEYVKNPDIRLILQPMKSILELREYLKKGFCITDESVVFEDGKYYQIICASYDGIYHEYTKTELELGKKNIEKRSDTFLKLLVHTLSKKEKILDGLITGGCDTSEIREEIKELKKLI